MIPIQGGNVTVMVANMDRAIKFYTETLGLKLANRYGDHWADIEAPGIAIGLYPTASHANKGDNLQIGLKVPDLDKAISMLERKGLHFNIHNDGQVRLAFFTDPDGNTLYLAQPQW
ncbi:MAG: VOC family protein [Cyclobacteriaceae bacterium]|nr:VOC family protein [Cyclobacteriaceae bacterium]MCB0498099.1 VOC family protein [Cyclobacteriaceae bacterium]MCB9238823.1 VOC family protein [Flammeovirgaceae bacterium]MCO5270542.1 VOC family protein [Cyclobacteriaceae bacterium]MCW5901017.1 VOC family protein [Cyclobacteriaceae bacterium]